MLNAWDCHCSGGEYKAPQGKPSNHKSFDKPIILREISRLG